jgi:hypothetical protein
VSLRTIFDRTVVLRITSPAGEDARGNETRGSADRPGVRAYRYQLAADEDTRDRDQQARTFVYFFPVTADSIELSGRDRIVDGDEILEVVGAPIVARKRRRDHHVEARALLLEG